MFNNSKKTYDVFTAKRVKNTYNEEIIEWEKTGEAEIFISLNTRTAVDNNDINITQCEYVGVTANNSIEAGMRISSSLLVQFVVRTKRESFLFLKEIESNGICEY